MHVSIGSEYMARQNHIGRSNGTCSYFNFSHENEKINKNHDENYKIAFKKTPNNYKKQ